MTEHGAFRVDLSPRAMRELRRLPPGEAARCRGPILALALEPRPYGASRIRGTPFWRIRLGTIRIVYAIDEAERSVVVVRVARRSESTYRGLREGNERPPSD